MNTKLIIAIFLIIFMILPSTTSAESRHISIDVYYNDQLYPGSSTPKPLVKIGEPFTVRFDVTCHSPGVLSVKLTELGDNSFEIIDGPTSKLEQYTDDKFETNQTITYEWTLEATEEWEGGSMPLDFVYQLNDFDTLKILTKGEFTAAYVTISEEYYEDSDSAASPMEDSGNSSNPTAPAFTALCAVFALVVGSIYRRKLD